ncbi:MAG: ribonuclease E/G, partial [Hyphomicrobiales bacterium]|nr:ribonuclease E/G [Hyphomicrobiales bacterium]
NQTEALVSIDVNSGRATREHNIEDTALATNLEAAEEIARQLRLRDLAGLIVIDFIDMEEKRNNRAVERKLKDCLKNDRARIQVGRISHFGLMEMSRQRIRIGVLEGSTEVCPHCAGAGIVRSTESVALYVLRSLEDLLLKGVTHHLTVRTRTPVALYILNQKRTHLTELESRFGLTVTVCADETVDGQHFVVEKGELVTARPEGTTAVQQAAIIAAAEAEVEDEEEEEERDDERRSKRRRRRRRPTDADAKSAEAGTAEAEESTDDDGTEQAPKSRRRGRRGGRRSRKARQNAEATTETAEAEAEGDAEAASETNNDDEGEVAPEAAEPAVIDDAPASAPETVAEVTENTAAETVAEEVETASGEETDEAPVPVAEPIGEETVEVAEDDEAVPASGEAAPEEDEDDEDRPRRTGWWQRRSFF